MSERLVEQCNPQPFHQPVEEWEPIFFDCRDRLCPALPTSQHAERYLEFLRHLISRNPANLAAHVRRVLIARSYRQGKVVQEALEELFRILGNKGKGLRRHLLALCAPFLDADTLKRLKGNASPSAAIPIVVRSSVPRASANEPSGSGETVVIEALGYLDAGQVEEAQVLLESHLQKTPEDVEATRVLLDIYRRARDHAAFTALRRQLEPLPASVRPLWDEAADRFESLS